MRRERERERGWGGGGGGGGVRPAAVAMATTSRCCRSSGRSDGSVNREEERRGEEKELLHPRHWLPHLKPVAATIALWVAGKSHVEVGGSVWEEEEEEEEGVWERRKEGGREE